LNKEFAIRFIRKIKIPFIRKTLLKYFYTKEGLSLQKFYSFSDDRFFVYEVNDVFIPTEAISWPISFETQLKKCQNESLFGYMPKTGDCIVDIGAGLGEETFLFAKLASDSGRVLAIEPHPDVYQVLLKTISLNKLSNVTALNIAVSDKEEIISLSDNQSSYEMTSVTNSEATEKLQIKANTIGRILSDQGVQQIDLLKVNIEGAEKFIPGNLSKSQVDNIHHIAIACHDFRYRKEGNDFFKTKDIVIKFLVENGFEIQTRSTGIDYLDDWVYGKKIN
jgi:FkbM family methyltransferase